MRTAKLRIRGWSESSLDTQVILLVLSCCRLYTGPEHSKSYKTTCAYSETLRSQPALFTQVDQFAAVYMKKQWIYGWIWVLYDLILEFYWRICHVIDFAVRWLNLKQMKERHSVLKVPPRASQMSDAVMTNLEQLGLRCFRCLKSGNRTARPDYFSAKTNKVTMRTAKTLISLGIRPVRPGW